jgi:hypothetical protein
MADTRDILGIRGIPQGPVIHIHLGSLSLRLPDSFHEHIHGALRGRLSLAVQHGDAQDHPRTGHTRRFVLFQNRSLTVELRLAIQVRGPGRRVGLVGRISGDAREDVVSRDVDEEDALGGSQSGERLAGCDVERPGTFRVLFDLVWEPLRSAWFVPLSETAV